MSNGREADNFPVGATDNTDLVTATDLLLHALRTGVPVSELLTF